MQNLDDNTAITKLDPSNVFGSIGMFPDQCEASWKEASAVTFPDEFKQVKNIVVCGMGGSRFTPRTVKELYQDKISIPYEIIDGYDLPGYVNEQTLVILSSYSGTTEEVISCGMQAIERKAKIAGIAFGGGVIDLLKKNNCPHYQFDAVKNPCGQPRIGGGYLLMAHIAFLKNLGFLSITDEEVSKSIAFSRTVGASMNGSVETTKNPAKQLALELKEKHVFFVAAEFMRGFVNGFANQMNETAKSISDFRYIPELNHHLLEGLKHPETLHTNGMFVFLESPLYQSKIQKRFAITKDVVAQQHVGTKSIMFTGSDKLSQILEGYVLAGYTTFYLAMRYDTDPVAIPWVDYFKAQLGK
ncbi:MAG: SIS domain-containing protein [Candidatus Gottesmanbacteria bacterium]